MFKSNNFKKKIKYRYLLPVLLIFALLLLFTACEDQRYAGENEDEGISVEVSSDGWDTLNGTNITLNGNSISVDGSGATVSGSTVNIISAGSYIFSGTLDDGQIIVYTEDDSDVNLVLNGSDISSSDSAPIYVLSANNVYMYLADGTENYINNENTTDVSDAGSEVPDAAIFSKSDLSIKGGGSLTVTSAANHGIKSNDDLEITGGNITVEAALDGIRGKDSVTIKNADVTVDAGGDAIKSNNDGDEDKGYVEIDSGTLNLTAGEDGIQAGTILTIAGGEINIVCGGGSANGTSQGNEGSGIFGGFSNNNADSSDTTSMKGIKSVSELLISAGNINIDSADDSIHSNGTITINGGIFNISAGDDGIHADTSIEINGGEFKISKSYEGMESAEITINDGNIVLVASDDGINVAGGNDSSSFNGQFGGGDNFNTSSGEAGLTINGGYIAIDASGDGIDVNSSVVMTDGTVIVSGPQSDGNGALDYNSTFNISGGLLVAVGSSGMAQAPSSDSTQYSMMINFSSTLEAGTMVHIQSSDGEDILTFVPERQYSSVVISSPELEEGETYTVYYGGSSTGEEENGLYTGGTYTPGTEYTSLSVTDTVTSYGTTGGSMGGGGMPAGAGTTKPSDAGTTRPNDAGIRPPKNQ